MIIQAVLLVSALASGPSPSCEPGVFDSLSQDLQPDRTIVENRARIERRCLDEDTELDEFFLLNADGATVFRGLSIVAWTPDRSASRTLWLMLGDPGHTEFTTLVLDGVGYSLGGGFDGSGDFLERSETRWTDEGVFLDLDRSFDSGRYWVSNFSESVTARREGEFPRPLAPLVDGLAANADHEDVVALLDGRMAMTVDNHPDQGRLITLSALYADGDEDILRELVWSPFTGRIVEVRHQALD
jgi:hypothetical protein